MKTVIRDYKPFIFGFFGWFLFCLASIFSMFRHHLPTGSKGWIYFLCEPACYALLLSALVFVMGKWRWLLLPVFVVAYLIECMEHWLIHAFGIFFTGDVFLLAFNSSWAEVKEFAGAHISFLGVALFGCALLLGVGLGIFLFKPKVETSWSKRLAVFFVSCIPFCVFNCFLLSPKRIPRQLMTSNFVTDTIETYAINKDLYAVCLNPMEIGDVKINGAVDHGPIGVFMIGESMTRNNLGVYGYERNTTPRMKKLQGEGGLFVFKDVLGTWSGTQGGIRHLLTETELGTIGAKSTFPEVCKRAGYDCFLLSNQGHWGAYDTMDSMIFRACSDMTWVADLGKSLFDVEMVEMLLDKFAEGHDKPTIGFVHLRGSHDPFAHFPKQFNVFGPAMTMPDNAHLATAEKATYNRYDNTILHTDATFGRTVEILKATRRPAFVLLVSDHGETPRTGKMRYFTHKDLWEIPLVIWVSEEFQKAYPGTVAMLRNSVNKKLQQDQLFLGMLSLAQIKGFSRYEETKDFLSDKFVPRKVRMIQKGEVPYEGDL